jgi:hypothetical protein
MNLENHKANMIGTLTKYVDDAIKKIDEQKTEKEVSLDYHKAELKKEIDKINQEAAQPEIIQQKQSVDVKPKGDSTKVKKLIYLNCPLTERPPQWTLPLRAALGTEGFLSFDPQVTLEQFTTEDLQVINKLSPKLIPSMCSFLRLPEDIGFEFSHTIVQNNMVAAEQRPTVDSVIFKDLWFLVRASVIIVDLLRPPIGNGFIQKIMYGKLLGIPTIGISNNDYLDPWVQKYLSVVFTDDFNVANFLPLIKGYTA